MSFYRWEVENEETGREREMKNEKKNSHKNE